MPISRPNRQASSISDRGTLALSAVTAILPSPNAKNAALATTVLSMPPLNATTTRRQARRISNKQSRLVISSGDSGNTAGSGIGVPWVCPVHDKAILAGTQALTRESPKEWLLGAL